ncbi:MAG: DUF448 domain-containing protein [Sulfurospirillum sp.]|nr:DUF448 domain-containing protein [Sulfurospirillum sp.]MBL0702829.1 DUF448 domain-containing protein [Sulfurospirillum sp.]
MKKPIRMCIICRGRYEQNRLIRFQLCNGKLVKFSHVGRSSYICTECILLEEKRLVKIMNSKFKLKYKKIDEFGNIFPTKET